MPVWEPGAHGLTKVSKSRWRLLWQYVYSAICHLKGCIQLWAAWTKRIDSALSAIGLFLAQRLGPACRWGGGHLAQIGNLVSNCHGPMTTWPRTIGIT